MVLFFFSMVWLMNEMFGKSPRHLTMFLFFYFYLSLPDYDNIHAYSLVVHNLDKPLILVRNIPFLVYFPKSNNS